MMTTMPSHSIAGASGTVEIHHFAVYFNDYGIAFKAIYNSGLLCHSSLLLASLILGGTTLGIPFYLHYLLLNSADYSAQ